MITGASVSAAIAAPAMNVQDAPRASHSQPARALASNIAMPLARLKKPNAVPHNSAEDTSMSGLTNPGARMPAGIVMPGLRLGQSLLERHGHGD